MLPKTTPHTGQIVLQTHENTFRAQYSIPRKIQPQDTKPQEVRLHNLLLTQLVSFLIN